jgi:alkylhydroperoxidase/carboxymuconolactone decarboxylase family protein YurZ
MYGAVIHAPRDVRYEERPEPTIIEPTDAVIRVVAACVCGSDLWRYRGISPVPNPTPIGHEYCGVVESVGEAVTTVKPGDFVVGGFNPCDNTCAACRKGATANCLNAAHYEGCQAEKLRVPLADGTLVATPEMPTDDLIPSILALSPDTKHIQNWLTANCFGDHYTRTGLEFATRELLTFVIIVAQGGCDSQARGHVAGNVRVGNSRDVLLDALSQLVPYIGYPRTLNGLAAINEIAPASA